MPTTQARSGRSRIQAFGIVGGLFVLSFAASAGITLAVSPTSGTASAEAAPTTTPEVSPTPTPDLTTKPQASLPSPTAAARQVTTQPTPRSTEPSRRQIRAAKDMLCSEDLQAIPEVADADSPKAWTEVLEVQAVARGHDVGPVDGRYDSSTRRGVKDLEQELDLPADGAFVTRDWEALQRSTCPDPSPTPSATEEAPGTGASEYPASTTEEGSSSSSSGSGSGGGGSGGGGSGGGGSGGGGSGGGSDEGGTLILVP